MARSSALAAGASHDLSFWQHDSGRPYQSVYPDTRLPRPDALIQSPEREVL